MNSLTHRLVALKIQDRLQQEFGVSLSKRRLVWGSTRPDFVPNPLSHYKDEKIDLLYEKWDRLRGMNLFGQIDTFTLELGQIFHFLCDYFCHAHNDLELVDGLWIHLKYEQQLHSVAKRLGNDFFRVEYAEDGILSFRELVEDKHNLYLQEEPSFENDLKWSFQMCLLGARKLFKEADIVPNYQIG